MFNLHRGIILNGRRWSRTTRAEAPDLQSGPLPLRYIHPYMLPPSCSSEQPYRICSFVDKLALRYFLFVPSQRNMNKLDINPLSEVVPS